MDYRRFTIPELAKVTRTSRHVLYEWVRKGYLVPTQYSGMRRKFSLEAFEKAEQLAKKEVQQKIVQKFITTPNKNQRIPTEFFDNLEEIIHYTEIPTPRSSGKGKNGGLFFPTNHKIKEDL